MTDRAALAEALRDLLGPGFGVGLDDPRAPADGLLPGELAATRGMVDRRLREFAAGRRAARAAMAEAGLPAQPVPMGPDRAPVWPGGLIGSIAHTRTIAIAAVARPGAARVLGLDIEEAEPLEPDLWDIVLTPSEAESAFADPDPGLAANCVFVAKEAVYKAQYPLTGRMLDFRDVTISPGPQGFSARIDGGPALAGRFCRFGTLVVAVVSIR